jgi:hypothetical protein
MLVPWCGSVSFSMRNEGEMFLQAGVNLNWRLRNSRIFGVNGCSKLVAANSTTGVKLSPRIYYSPTRATPTAPNSAIFARDCGRYGANLWSVSLAKTPATRTISRL